MTEYVLSPAQSDWGRFIDIFNRCTVYAPYTILLTPELVEKHLDVRTGSRNDLVLTATDGQSEGILHAGIEQRDGVQQGFVYMLLAESNGVAQSLLQQAEKWFAGKGACTVVAFGWCDNPYRFILHGSEVYGWAGCYPAVNAFYRQGWGIAMDVVVMMRELEGEPGVMLPDDGSIALVESAVEENDLVWRGTVVAFVDGKRAGQCHFQHMKAISSYYRKGMGQFNMGADPSFHGKGVAQALLSFAHKRLYGRGVRKMMLTTNQGLFRAICFYEKLGYEVQPIRAYGFSKEF